MNDQIFKPVACIEQHTHREQEKAKQDFKDSLHRLYLEALKLRKIVEDLKVDGQETPRSDELIAMSYKQIQEKN